MVQQKIRKSQDYVKLLIDTQAAFELNHAVRIALDVAAVAKSSEAGADAFWLIARKRSALELLQALALTLGLSPTPQPNDDDQKEDAVAIIVTNHTAELILRALTVSLGIDASKDKDSEGDKGVDVVEVIILKLTAMELFNSFLTHLGAAGNGETAKKAGKGGASRGLPAEGAGAGKPGASGNGDPPSVTDEVDCTVYAAGQASRGNSFLVQVFAHLPEQTAALEQIAKEAEPEAKRRVVRTLEKQIQRGSRLTFNMTMPDQNIDEPSQSLIWRGKPASVQFAVTVPENFKPRDIICTIVVSESSIPIGHLKFTFKIVSAGSSAAMDSQPVPVGNLIRYQQAFISYASADRVEVLKRVQMLNASKVKFFQDLLTLEPGDLWEKSIYQYIDQSDVFFLFWSTAASKSRWVEKEIAYARERQAGNAAAAPEIVPILIEGPPPAKPPEQLSFLHFNDKFLYFLKAEAGLADA
jgi:hypothetical protein